MLGKQWLNIYVAADVRGSAAQRSQNRQQKLDALVKWRFGYLMELLPLLLQGALFLLCLALSRYFWEIDTTTAYVAVGVTSFGVVFYTAIVGAAAAFGSCPYRTPGSRLTRFLGRSAVTIAKPTCRSAVAIAKPTCRLAVTIVKSICRSAVWIIVKSICRSAVTIVKSICRSAVTIVESIYRSAVWIIVKSICRSAVWIFVVLVTVFGRFLYQYWKFWMLNILWLELSLVNQLLRILLAQVLLVAIESDDALGTNPGLIAMLFFISARRVYLWRAAPVTERGLDLRCTSWMIQASFDKEARTSALKYLQTLTRSPYFEPTTITGCFNVFISCINVSGRNVTIVQGSEELATLSATCFLRTLLCHSASPAYAYRPAIEEVRWRYNQTFPHPPNFETLPVCYTMAIIHYRLVNRRRRKVSWRDCTSSSRDHPFVAQTLAELAKPQKRRGSPKVPRWILRFALHSLSQDLPPPTSVVADCLSIVATDLGCTDVPNTGTTPDERCVYISQMDITLTLNQHMLGASFGFDNPETRRDAHGRGFTITPFWA